MACGIRLACFVCILHSVLTVAKGVASEEAVQPKLLGSVGSLPWAQILPSDQLPDASVSAAQKSICAERSDRAKCELAIEHMLPVLSEWATRRAEAQQQQSSLDGAEASTTADCSLCKYAVAYVKTSVDSDATKEAVGKATQEACAELPAEFQDTCIDIMARYEDLLIQYVKSTNAVSFCTSVGACKKSVTFPLLPRSVSTVLSKLRPRVTGSFCSTCKIFVTEAHDLIEDPDTQEEIIDFIKSSCQTVVPMFADICSEYVDEYGPAVFALLDEYLTDDLCSSFGFCADQAKLNESVQDSDDVDVEYTALPDYVDEQRSEAELRDQQEDLVAYIASMLVSQDIEAKRRGEPYMLRGNDRSAITQQLIEALGLDSKSKNKVDTKVPEWLSQTSESVSSRKLMHG